jgi:uncharacterized protein
MGPERQPQRHQYSWHDVIILSEKLGEQLTESYPDIEVIVGVLRGGAFPALMLSHMLGVSRMYAVRVSSRGDGTPRTYRNMPLIEGINGLPSLQGQVVLIVDDVTNTGNTLKNVKLKVNHVGQPAAIVTASLVWDTVGADDDHFLTDCVADCYSESVHAWVDFPWEYSRVMTSAS